MARGIGLRPNWDEHDAATCPIINYFADRHNTELVITKQEKKKQERPATFAICAKTVTDLKNAEPNFKNGILDI